MQESHNKWNKVIRSWLNLLELLLSIFLGCFMHLMVFFGYLSLWDVIILHRVNLPPVGLWKVIIFREGIGLGRNCNLGRNLSCMLSFLSFFLFLVLEFWRNNQDGVLLHRPALLFQVYSHWLFSGEDLVYFFIEGEEMKVSLERYK